jgi:hypothetical protein
LDGLINSTIVPEALDIQTANRRLSRRDERTTQEAVSPLEGNSRRVEEANPVITICSSSTAMLTVGHRDVLERCGKSLP